MGSWAEGFIPCSWAIKEALWGTSCIHVLHEGSELAACPREQGVIVPQFLPAT